MNTPILKYVNIRSYEIGLYFRNREFKGLLARGRHWLFDPWSKVRVEVVSMREPWLVHEKLDVIVKSGALQDRAVVLDLKDYERALVWIEGRFSHILPPGLYAYWTTLRAVKVEVIDARKVRFVHTDLRVIMRSTAVDRVLEIGTVEPHHVGVLFVDGDFVETLPPGRYAFWKNLATVKFVQEDMREAMFDVAGQDIMTADKVTLRMNAVVTYRVVDARQAVSVADDVRQALYREVQLALRAVVGARELDSFLTDKDAVANELAEIVRPRAKSLGLELISVGIRDIILPGEMKDLMNKVTEAKKAAEANLIVRREETAAMRSQVNTAKLLQDNPTLMRLRELEVLEKIAATSKLNVLLGEKGLADRVVNLL
ncbi:MAG TPA: slipin family protein [Pirellulales bacterium]|nr:slipin family protein [Pirellulales bacterium]